MPQLSASVLAVLADLSAALDDPAVDIGASLLSLAGAVESAVASYGGLALTIETYGEHVVLVAMNEADTDGSVSTSLHIPLTRNSPVADIDLILYARSPGALVDLAADLQWLVGTTGAEFTHDAHLQVPVESLRGLAELSTVNQAIGVLLAGGYTLEQAVGMLDTLGRDRATDRHDAAAALLVALDEERRTP